MPANDPDTSEFMQPRVITIELRSKCTPLEAQLLRDAALNAAWQRAREFHIEIVGSTRIETRNQEK